MLCIDSANIVVFDSGVGGLAIFDEIIQLLPDLNYIYVFDNAGFPYGEKDEKYVINSIMSILRNIIQQFSIKLLVIACNSASVVSLPILRKTFNFPIIGVVPAIKPATLVTRNHIIGLLATVGTTKSSYTHSLITKFAKECQIKILGASALVNLAEDKLHGKKIILEDIQLIIQSWIEMVNPPDTVVLGCTHFHLLRNELQCVLPKGTNIIDSGKAIAQRAFSILKYELPTLISSGKRIAFCTRMDNKVKQLSLTLKSYGFFTLNTLNI